MPLVTTPDDWKPVAGDRVIRRHRPDAGVGVVLDIRPRASFPYMVDFRGTVDGYQGLELRPASAGDATPP